MAGRIISPVTASDMSETPTISNPQVLLRDHAETLLRLRSAPAGRGWPVGTDALELLHNLASAPDGADDALKLLHELQVHQVELDMQQEQVEAAQQDCVRELERYRALFDFLPVAYLMLADSGAVVEANRLAGVMLGIAPADLPGRQFVDFLDSDQRAEIRSGLSALQQQTLDVVCKLAADTGNNNGARLRLRARRMPGPEAEGILLTLSDREPAQKTG